MARAQTLPPQPVTPPGRRRAVRWQSVAAWGLVALPIILFGILWQRYAVNVAKWDDHALRGFLAARDQATTFTGKVLLFFSQHNEHRIVYDRLITALDYGLTGKLNYVHLMVVGNLSLAGLLLVFGLVLRASGHFRHHSTQLPLALAPVAWLLFNLSQWENMYWGMAALQNFSVVLWVMAALYYLSYTNRLGLALLFAVLATLTSGNGLMVWPLGLLLLILRNAEPRRSLRPIVGWVAGALLVVGLYFTGFAKPGGIAYIRPGLSDLLKGWLAVIGAAGEALPIGMPLRTSILLGALLLIGTLAGLAWTLIESRVAVGRLVRGLLPGRSDKQAAVLPAFTLFYVGAVLFILGTAAVVAWARAGFGADLLITSRYKMYSLTLLALLYVYALVALPERTVRGTTVAGWIGGVALAWLSYYSFLDETIWWRHWNLTNQFNWTFVTNRPVAQSTTPGPQYTDPEPGFYETMLPALYGSNSKPPVPAVGTSAADVTVTKTATGYVVQNTTVAPLGLVDEGAYLLLRSAKRVYLLPVWQNRASLKQSRLGFGNPFTSGFTATLGPGELGGLDPGTYTLSVLVVAGNHQPTVYPTNQTITSAGAPVDTTTKNW